MRLLGSSGRRRKAKTALAVGLVALLVTACGQAKQDAHEPNATFTLKVLHASFPAKQAVAKPSALELEILNAGTSTVPNVAVTVVSFYYRSEFPHLAEHARPIWVVDQGPGAVPQKPVETVLNSPGGNVTSTANTWAAGPLAAGESRTFRWMLTPVKTGTHTVAYKVAAGLSGKARAQTVGGGPLGGFFRVDIAPQPPVNHVNPETGEVEAGPNPVVPGP
jgi:hypothetical protein